jgi:hypothetical protein
MFKDREGSLFMLKKLLLSVKSVMKGSKKLLN